MTPRYHINIFWSDEDECWVADVPDLESCTVRGRTPEQVMAEIEDSMMAWIERARQERIPIPEPSYQPRTRRCLMDQLRGVVPAALARFERTLWDASGSALLLWPLDEPSDRLVRRR